jgi:ParB family chromosome partitioning protein
VAAEEKLNRKGREGTRRSTEGHSILINDRVKGVKMIQEKKRALGRGLESLIPAARATATVVAPPAATVAAATTDAVTGERVLEVRLDEVEESPYQPRRHQRDERALEELAQSIRAQGVLQPIVVRYISGESMVGGRSSMGGKGAGVPHPSNTGLGGPPTGDGADAGARVPQGQASQGQPPQIKYQLIAGERRWLASKLAGKTTVPAIVRTVSNEQAMEMALIENLQREDLDCLEMAYAFERLSKEFALTQEEMAKRTGKDRGTIGNLLRLLKLPPEIRAALAKHDLSFGHAKELMSIEDDTVMVAAAQRVMRESLSVRQTELLVNKLVYLGPVSEKEYEDRKRRLKEANVDPNVKSAREELERNLGCRVKIFDKHGKGRVVIEYKGLDDFDRIVEALGK